MYVILVYDIKSEDNGQKRWRNIFKICKRYLVHIQNSVFEGDITKSDIVRLKMEIDQYIDKDLDSVIIFKSRDKKWLDKEVWGIDENNTDFII